MRERLYLSYVARDAQTGDELAPSTVVHRADLRHLQRGRTDDPRELSGSKNSRLRRFDDSYFASKDAPGSDAKSSRQFLCRPPGRSRRPGNFDQKLRDHCSGTPRLTPDALRRLDRSVVDWLGLCPIDGARAEPSHRAWRSRFVICWGFSGVRFRGGRG